MKYTSDVNTFYLFDNLILRDLSYKQQNVSSIYDLNNINVIQNEVEEIEDASATHYHTKKIELYTNENRYIIICRITYEDRESSGTYKIDPRIEHTYLGCQVQSRKARPGEDWHRGNDLPDGPLTEETWHEILRAIVCYESVKVHKSTDTLNQDISDELKNHDFSKFVPKFIRINHPEKGIIPLNPNPEQQKLINKLAKSKDEKFVFDIMDRTSGKTSLLCSYALWEALYLDNLKILYLSSNFNNNKNVMKVITGMYKHLVMRGLDETENIMKNKINFSNGSEIIYSSKCNLRGKSIDLVILDEFAFFEEDHAQKVKDFLDLTNPNKIVMVSSYSEKNSVFKEFLKESL